MSLIIDPPTLTLRRDKSALTDPSAQSPLDLQLSGYQLTTAQILYHLPDHPRLLQTYLWQEYDLTPQFPALTKFLTFWERELDGKLHSVHLNVRDDINTAAFSFFSAEYVLH